MMMALSGLNCSDRLHSSLRRTIRKLRLQRRKKRRPLRSQLPKRRKRARKSPLKSDFYFFKYFFEDSSMMSSLYKLIPQIYTRTSYLDHFPSKGRALDIGCGSGAVLDLL